MHCFKHIEKNFLADSAVLNGFEGFKNTSAIISEKPEENVMTSAQILCTVIVKVTVTTIAMVAAASYWTLMTTLLIYLPWTLITTRYLQINHRKSNHLGQR